MVRGFGFRMYFEKINLVSVLERNKVDTYKILAVYCVGQARENDTLN